MSKPSSNGFKNSSPSARAVELPLPVALSEFSRFFDSALGQRMLDTERTRLKQELAHLVGYNGIQLSVLRGQPLLDQESMGHAVKLGYALEGDNNDDVLTDLTQLPVPNECADVLLLHHVLEFTADPTQLLREAHRVVKPGGHIVVYSYNLMSLWPIYIRLWLWKSQTRWSNLPALRQGRVHDWLMALNYDIIVSDKMTGRLPVNHPAWVNRMQRVEHWFDRIGFPLGMVSLSIACKRSQPVNPLMSPDWKRLFHGKPQTVSPHRSANSAKTD